LKEFKEFNPTPGNCGYVRLFVQQVG